MQRAMAVKKMFLFVCICIIVISGCQAQTQKGFRVLFGAASSQELLQIPKVHTESPNMLAEGQWLDVDDAVSHVSMHNKKTSLVCKDALRLFAIDALLAGIAALFAYAYARIYHGSSCPTRGLLRMLAFILKSDGQKDQFSIYF